MLKQDVIEFFGHPVQVADFLRITRQAVHAWDENIPEKQAARLHALTQGQLKYNIEDYRDEFF